MKNVYGETKSLKASERDALERLVEKRTGPSEFIDAELLKKAAKLGLQLGVQLGLLIGRDGRVTHVVVGSKNRIYLPDLGRFRLDSARLRQLRLVVLLPDGEKKLERFPRGDSLFSMGGRKQKASKSGGHVMSPVIAGDLITDLEKLRLDSVLVVSVLNDGTPGPISLAYLNPTTGARGLGSSKKGAREGDDIERAVGIFRGRDIHEVDFSFADFIEELERGFSRTVERGFKTGGEGAVLVGAYTGSGVDAEASMEELKELARTAGINVVDVVTQRRKSLDPRTVLGKGKVEELVLHCLDLGVDLLIFDRELAPGQLRSITNLTELRVIDRSMLILDVFAQRAKSSEGRLQVELAQLKYSLPRLTESDTGLSRLTGGIGGRGPGETKLEIGRRRARDRITLLERKIDQVSLQRGVRRERRQVRGVPAVAIVGYTNAGKSTLLNALTKGDVFVENKLFATLDPSSRRMRFPNDREVIFVDTVGFIRELPKELVAAFRATLEEVDEADLVIHLVDASNPELLGQIEVVEKTLDDLGFREKPKLLVLNKIDRLSAVQVNALTNSLNALAVSALTRIGLQELILRVQEELSLSFKGQDPGGFIELPSESPPLE